MQPHQLSEALWDKAGNARPMDVTLRVVGSLQLVRFLSNTRFPWKMVLLELIVLCKFTESPLLPSPLALENVLLQGSCPLVPEPLLLPSWS